MKISLEAKVGLLILVAALLLGSFLFVLGGVSFADDYTVYVYFDNPGSVQPGAAVRVAGVKVGTVESVEYLGRRWIDPETGRRPLVKFRLSINTDVQDTIHAANDENQGGANFYVTSQGVLGEQFIAIDPGEPTNPVLRDGASVYGTDPPRLDEALARGFELLEIVVDGIEANRDDLGTLLDDVVALVHQLRLLLTDNRGDLDTIVDNVRTLIEEGITTLRGAREAYIDGDRPQRIMRNVDRTLALMDREAPGLIRDVSEAAHAANQVLGPEQQTQLRNTIASAERVASGAEQTMADAQGIVTHIREGQGTVGALLMDEEIYDDLQEMIRDLKHNPWKFFWRE